MPDRLLPDRPEIDRAARHPSSGRPCENHRRSTVDLLQHPQVLQETKADFQERMKDRKYTTKIPKQQKAPRAIR